MRDSIDILNPDFVEEKELFTEKAISISALLGGPLAAIYFIAKNFISLGKEEAARKTWFIGLPVFLIIFLIIFNLPDNILDSSYTKLFQLLWPITAYLVVKVYQRDEIKEHLNKGGKTGSGWKIFGYSLAAFFITFLFFVVLALLTYKENEERNIPIDNMAVVQTYYHGCNIYYDSVNVTSIDAKVVGSYLEQFWYFNSLNKDADAIVTKKENIYTITLAIHSQYFNNTEIHNVFKTIIKDMKRLYNDRQYQFRIVGIDSSGIHGEKIIK